MGRLSEIERLPGPKNAAAAAKIVLCKAGITHHQEDGPLDGVRLLDDGELIHGF